MNVTQKQLAAILGRDVTTVQAWHAEGLPVVAGKRGAANKYDLTDCVAWFVSHELEKAAEGGTKGRIERIKAAREELALYRDAGKVVLVDVVRSILDRWFESSLNVMDGLEEKYALRFPQVAGDDAALRDTLRALVREIRDALADIDLTAAFAGTGSGDSRVEHEGGSGSAGEVSPPA